VLRACRRTPSDWHGPIIPQVDTLFFPLWPAKAKSKRGEVPGIHIVVGARIGIDIIHRPRLAITREADPEMGEVLVAHVIVAVGIARHKSRTAIQAHRVHLRAGAAIAGIANAVQITIGWIGIGHIDAVVGGADPSSTVSR
jgi:hypothetical protein